MDNKKLRVITTREKVEIAPLSHLELVAFTPQGMTFVIIKYTYTHTHTDCKHLVAHQENETQNYLPCFVTATKWLPVVTVTPRRNHL